MMPGFFLRNSAEHLTCRTCSCWNLSLTELKGYIVRPCLKRQKAKPRPQLLL